MTRGKGIVAALVGGALLIIAAVMAFQSLRAQGFHSVQGTVLSTKLESVVVGPSNLHKPVIEYSYVVGGVRYRNDVFNFLDDQSTEEWARAVLHNYRVGAACSVYYDPSNPHMSVLSISPNYQAIWVMVGLTFLGLVHLIGGIVAARLAPERGREKGTSLIL